jgi:hypothetical protein
LFALGFPTQAKGAPLEIWFQGEARLRPARRVDPGLGQAGNAAPSPARPTVGAYLFGAVRPERRAAAALVMPTANAEVMSPHLAEIARNVAPGAHAALILDGAGHPIAEKLKVPPNITLVPPPPHAPELNPMENVWECLRGNQLAIAALDDYEDILDAACDAWMLLENDKERIATIAARSWATVNI